MQQTPKKTYNKEIALLFLTVQGQLFFVISFFRKELGEIFVSVHDALHFTRLGRLYQRYHRWNDARNHFITTLSGNIIPHCAELHTTSQSLTSLVCHISIVLWILAIVYESYQPLFLSCFITWHIVFGDIYLCTYILLYCTSYAADRFFFSSPIQGKRPHLYFWNSVCHIYKRKMTTFVLP